MPDALPQSIRIEKVVKLRVLNPILHTPQHPKYDIQARDLDPKQKLISMLTPQTPSTPSPSYPNSSTPPTPHYPTHPILFLLKKTQHTSSLPPLLLNPIFCDNFSI
jgi:hypothetical protein